MMTRIVSSGLPVLFALCLLLSAPPASAAEPHDRRALEGVEVGKGIFDVNRGDPRSILLILGVIEETVDGLLDHGVEPDLIVAFRGPAPRFLLADSDKVPLEHVGAAEDLARYIQQLAARGVRFEACAITLRLMGLEQERLIPEVTVVANTFNSLIGYQARGYALIPIL